MIMLGKGEMYSVRVVDLVCNGLYEESLRLAYIQPLPLQEVQGF
jgi:hypothetical protein